MRLRVYRSLLGSSYHFHSHRNVVSASNSNTVLKEQDKDNTNQKQWQQQHQHLNIAATESSLSSLLSQSDNDQHVPVPVHNDNDDTPNNKCSTILFDGAVLSLSQYQHIIEATDCSSTSSPSPWMPGGLFHRHHHHDGFGFICQLNMDPICASSTSSECEEYIKYQFSQLSELLNNAQRKRNQYQQLNSRPMLDMIIFQTPSFTLPLSSSSSSSSSSSLYEYLSSILSSSAIFQESLPTNCSIGISDRKNIQGKPLGQHIHGISHTFNQEQGLDVLEDVADTFPPTRFVLSPENLRSSGMNSNIDDTCTTAPSMSDAFGLRMGLESVVDNTDVIRVSPSTFHVNGLKEGDVNNHGLFGAGTLFGHIWSAQQLDGALETYVICDDDQHQHEHENEDSNTNRISSLNKNHDCGSNEINITQQTHKDEPITYLAQNLRAAYAASQKWRDGAEERRNEEIELAARESRKKVGNAWMAGQYGPEVAESARIFGLFEEEDDDDDDGGGNRGKDNYKKHRELQLTIELIRKRWNVLAFQSHPDTNSSKKLVTMPFEELRNHFLILMKAAKQEEEDRRSKP